MTYARGLMAFHNIPAAIFPFYSTTNSAAEFHGVVSLFRNYRSFFSWVVSASSMDAIAFFQLAYKPNAPKTMKISPAPITKPAVPCTRPGISNRSPRIMIILGKKQDHLQDETANLRDKNSQQDENRADDQAPQFLDVFTGPERPYL
jgi:hypothetical protein